MGLVPGDPPCVCLATSLVPHLWSLSLPPIAQIFIFIGETLLSMNWAIVADILLVSKGAVLQGYPRG